jgi:hypothetical protein
MACLLRELSAELALPAETPVCCAVSGSAGLGLSAVGDTVKALGGRASASVKDGIFALRITL